MASASSFAAPPWMRHVLMAAAVYNLAWGASTIVAPQWYFRWSGMADINHAMVWQCVGMIVGVYGVGYAIAATQPYRHWPIVLVGLLGKILGPLGMARQLLAGTVPLKFAAVILTNDLIWWAPFFLILRAAYHAFQQEAGTPEPDSLSSALATTTIQNGNTLANVCRNQTCCFVFLRHLGCTFCRQALADVQAQWSDIQKSGARLILVHMSPEEDAAPLMKAYGVSHIDRVSDPGGRLYRAMGLKRGNLRQLLGPEVMWRGAKAFFGGHGIGKISGDGTRLGGVFIVKNGAMVRAFPNRSAADRPNYAAIVKESV